MSNIDYYLTRKLEKAEKNTGVYKTDIMSFSNTSKPYILEQCQGEKTLKYEQLSKIDKGHVYEKAMKTCRSLIEKPGVHSSTYMQSAGFIYTGHFDTVRCQTCGLQVSDWTSDMNPFTIHLQQSPLCTYVMSIVPSDRLHISATSILKISINEQQPLITREIDSTHVNNQPMTLTEADTLKQVRKRTFSHWPSRSSLSTAQMIEAGFFSCNVGDRVICIYCNIICQQWTPHTDNPSHLHKILSPKCPYVIAMLTRSPLSSISVINDQQSTSHMLTSSNNAIVCTAACNPAYIEIPKRYASFASWSAEKMPSIDDLVRAGFFFSGTKTIVTCFYCNGSLQNWGEHDNPMIEHARWFPQCAYAKQLCGNELYRKIQESKRAQQEKTKVNDTSGRGETSDSSSNYGQLIIPDENTLSRMVAARLDLPISVSLLNCNFKVSIIKRCWEDQLRLKRQDFVSDCDLLMACIILQKQINGIDGKKENIIIPNVPVRNIPERQQADICHHEQVVSDLSSRNSSADEDVEMTILSERTNIQTTAGTTRHADKMNSSPARNTAQISSNGALSLKFCIICRAILIPCCCHTHSFHGNDYK